jgi:hypothetical protein
MPRKRAGPKSAENDGGPKELEQSAPLLPRLATTRKPSTPTAIGKIKTVKSDRRMLLVVQSEGNAAGAPPHGLRGHQPMR